MRLWRLKNDSDFDRHLKDVSDWMKQWTDRNDNTGKAKTV